MKAGSLALILATAIAVAPLAAPAFAQSSKAGSRAALARDAAPVPESGAPDPLAPAEVEGPAPLAPGAADAASATASPAAEADPIVVLVRERIAALKPRGSKGDREDLAAAKAYYDTAGSPLWVAIEGLKAKARVAADEIGRADDWGLKASAYELPVLSDLAPGPEALAEAELKLSLAALAYARHARGGRVEPSSISRKFDQKPAVFEPGSVLRALAATDKADTWLQDLHPKHPQFVRLRQALAGARAEQKAGEAGGAKPNGLIQQIIVNMERWRWMPTDLGKFYVWDSIPDQMTSVVDNGRVVLSERIIVGKVDTPTPVFSADMQFVIFHPSWGVPPGIKSNELLPRLRDTGGGGWFSTKPLASSVLKAHGLQVTRGGTPVNPDAIDWSKIDVRSFEFTQPPGPTNVLGVVKFRFPNRHDVYMHDTPERQLFNGSVRAFSHGCMRVQNPIRLAEVLLAHDKGWSTEKVREQSRFGNEVRLTNPIPVHVTYFTAMVDDNGALIRRPDIYGLDSRVASALAGHDVRIASVAPPRAEGEPRPKATPRAPKDRRTAAAAPGPAASSAFRDPFAN